VAGIDGYAARTDDGGKTWVAIAGIPKRHLFGIAAGKQGNILIVGNALLLQRAGGRSDFSLMKTEPPITYGWLYRIASRGSSGFVAVGKGGWIYVSDAGGVNWQKVTY
jgi:hypothetical protein